MKRLPKDLDLVGGTFRHGGPAATSFPHGSAGSGPMVEGASASAAEAEAEAERLLGDLRYDTLNVAELDLRLVKAKETVRKRSWP
jgi:hypothetical protein